jgi:hypothetical protein
MMDTCISLRENIRSAGIMLLEGRDANRASVWSFIII